MTIKFVYGFARSINQASELKITWGCVGVTARAPELFRYREPHIQSLVNSACNCHEAEHRKHRVLARFDPGTGGVKE